MKTMKKYLAVMIAIFMIAVMWPTTIYASVEEGDMAEEIWEATVAATDPGHTEESEEGTIEMISDEAASEVEAVLPEDSSNLIPDGPSEVLAEEIEEAIPEVVGVGVTVGDNVTATFDPTTGAVEFDSHGGTLWNDWQERGGLDSEEIKSIKVASGIVYLPEDSSHIFSVKNYDSYYDEEDDEVYGRYVYPLEELDLSSFDTSKVEDMSSMFYGCSSLTNIDLSGFDTSNVWSMWCMFDGCSSLTNLDFSSFDTSNVENMDYMFCNCSSLTNLDLSSFNTSNVMEMSSIFINCSSLKNLDLSSFDTSNVEYMYSVFCNCSSLTNLDLSSFDTSNVLVMDSMFTGCSSLQLLKTPKKNIINGELPCIMFDKAGNAYEELPILSESIVLTIGVAGEGPIQVGDGVTATFYASTGTVELTSQDGELWRDWIDKLGVSRSNIKSIKVSSGTVYLPADSCGYYYDNDGDSRYYLFSGLSRLNSLDLSSFDTSKVTDMSYMFYYCTSLTDLDLSNFDTSNVTNMRYMFYNCGSLTNLDLSNFNSSKVSDMAGMFFNCNLINLDLSNFDTSGVTNMYGMFEYCSSLNNLDLSSFDTSNVTNMRYMFYGCQSLKNLDLSSFDTSNVETMSDMFFECSSLTNLNLSSFKTSKVSDMAGMFLNCSSLTNLGLSSFDTSNVETMSDMFFGCSSLTNLDLSSFNTLKVKHMSSMFSGCANLTSLELSNFETSNVSDMAGMFLNCSSLTSLDLSSFDTSNVVDMDYIFSRCAALQLLKTPKKNEISVELPAIMYDDAGNKYEALPFSSESIVLTRNKPTTKTDISNCEITLSASGYTYDGNAKKPSVTVKNGDAVLAFETDYTVSYSDNTNAGTATVTVTGTGNYKGEKSVIFTINKADAQLAFAESAVTKKTTDAAFTNTLTKTTDGTVTFTSSDTEVATVDSESGLVTIKGIGTTTVTAVASEGKNYKAGSAEYTLTVEDGRIDISGLTATLSVTSYTYDGKAKQPTVTVKNGDAVLTSGTDYAVSYVDNTNAGTATVKVTGTGNYKGEKSVTFTINKADAKLTFAESAVTKKTTDSAFTNTLTKTTDGTVTFKSGDTKVATVDSTSGLVTIKGAGTTTITATASEGQNYKTGSAAYTLTIEAPAPTPTPTPAASGFSDVQDPNHAYYKAIYWAADAGITKGYPDGTFGINKSCTRGEMIMFLWRYAGKPAPKAVSKSPFKDVAKTHAFYKAILWASQKGITKGYPDGTFGIDRNVSRGECMMFLWRVKGKPAPKAVAKSPFKDVATTNAFYKAILWGYQNKITTGYTSGAKKGTFGIDENCTRGQIVTFLYRAK